MSYNYTDGDGLDVLDVSEPNGAAEPLSNLDDAIRQIKAYLKDSTGGLAKLISRVEKLEEGDTSAAANNASFVAYLSSSQSVNQASGAVLIPFDQEVTDPDSCFNTINSRFVAPVNGTYMFILS